MTVCPQDVLKASRPELLVLAAYFFLLVFVTDALNVRFGVELATLSVVIAAVLISRLPGLFLRDWWFFIAGMVLWNVSGPVAAYSPFPSHVDLMLNVDRLLLLGRDPVVVVQHSLASPGHLTWLDYASAAVYNLHVPEPFIFGYFLWRINRAVFLQFAAAALILLVLGFVTFILFPAVPPWMASTRYHVIPYVYNGFGPVLHSYPAPFHGTPLFYVFKWKGDAVAAFPSEHAAFPLLEFLAFARAAGRWSFILLGWVVAVLFVILYLGEHWVTDAVAGWIYALAVFGFVVWFCRR